MLIALIESGMVVNVIVCDMENCSLYESDFDHVIDITGQEVGIGWEYDGTDFIAPPPPPEEEL